MPGPALRLVSTCPGGSQSGDTKCHIEQLVVGNLEQLREPAAVIGEFRLR